MEKSNRLYYMSMLFESTQFEVIETSVLGEACTLKKTYPSELDTLWGWYMFAWVLAVSYFILLFVSLFRNFCLWDQVCTYQIRSPPP